MTPTAWKLVMLRSLRELSERPIISNRNPLKTLHQHDTSARPGSLLLTADSQLEHLVDYVWPSKDDAFDSFVGDLNHETLLGARDRRGCSRAQDEADLAQLQHVINPSRQGAGLTDCPSLTRATSW
mmetsp:Transcript_19027/g.62581  ORF Transcript_19027/g.62581 Transcript_19027/m.62581 type:complete len:126 (-) Transcript_19027:1181-1558(-)